MENFEQSQATIDAPTLKLLIQERARALSPREWKFRLAGYGLAIKEVAGSQVLLRLPQGTELGVVPGNLA